MMQFNGTLIANPVSASFCFTVTPDQYRQILALAQVRSGWIRGKLPHRSLAHLLACPLEFRSLSPFPLFVSVTEYQKIDNKLQPVYVFDMIRSTVPRVLEALNHDHPGTPVDEVRVIPSQKKFALVFRGPAVCRGEDVPKRPI
jgi:hypothetical protein